MGIFNRRQRDAELLEAEAYLQAIARKYEGREVIEHFPSGNTFKGVITRFIWDASIGLEGDWNIYVQFDNTLPGNWTTWEALEFTSKRRVIKSKAKNHELP